MNKQLTILLTFLLGLTLSHTSFAEDEEGNYAIWGVGGKSCFAYSKARAAEKDKDFKAYLMGYMTAYNTVVPDTYSISGNMKLPEVLEWIDNFCDERQIESYDRAIGHYISDHREKRFKKPKYQGIDKGWGS